LQLNVSKVEGAPNMHKKAFCCWSGGKDCSLALYKARKAGVEVRYLLNMVSQEGNRSCSHGLNAALLRNQAAAANMTLLQGKTTDKNYETEFKENVLTLKANGINSGVFGDIDLMAHRNWIEKVAVDLGIEALFPLWEIKREVLMEEFITAGFKAVVCSVNKNMLGTEWLGREIDREFVHDIKKKGGIDLCGEKGEYHSFVYDGPLFRMPVPFEKGSQFSDRTYSYIELLDI
jgi:uncharacterized protein (TIGR00290 family)